MKLQQSHLEQPEVPLAELWTSELPIDYVAVSLCWEGVREMMRLDSSMISDVRTPGVQSPHSVLLSLEAHFGAFTDGIYCCFPYLILKDQC